MATTALDRAEARIAPGGKLPKYRRMPLNTLFIDPRYQRDIIPTHLEKIRKEFDISQLDALHVSERDDGSAAVFDGQHRFLVLDGSPHLQGPSPWPEDWAPCLVHTGLTPQQEADLFRALQDNRRPLTPLDKFKARLFGDEPIAKGMKVICDELGYEIGIGPKSLQAVVVVERVYRRGNLYDTLDILRIWKGDGKWLEGSLIDGVSRFLDLYPEADRTHAREKWAEASPTLILRRSTEFMASAHSSKAYGVLEVVRDLYTSRQWMLPKVAAAMEERKATQGTVGRRYRRLTGEEVRDAIIRLSRDNAAPGEEFGRWSIPELMEALQVGRSALTKRGGFIDTFIERGMVVRERESTSGQGSGGGKYVYRYIPPAKQRRMSQRKSGSNGIGPRGHTRAVAGTGKPKRRPGTRDVMRQGRS